MWLGSAAAGAQTHEERRVSAFVGGGYQMSTHEFSDHLVFPLFGEEAEFDADYRWPKGPYFDVNGSVRIWRRLGAGVGISILDRDEQAAVTGRVPHPLVFDRPRTVSGESPELRRQEHAVHIFARALVVDAARVGVFVFGGPTRFDVTHDLVTEVQFTQSAPFDTATFAATVTEEREESVVGFHAGADVVFSFTPQVGLGWLLRFSHGSVDFVTGDGDTIDVDVGGAQTAVGLRVSY
jgi:hypothetical protein